jgi:hypothetical protein
MVGRAAIPSARRKQVIAPQELVSADIGERRLRNVVDDAGIVKIQNRERPSLLVIDVWSLTATCSETRGSIHVKIWQRGK